MIKKKLNTKESREYWEPMKKIRKRIRRWPKWKKDILHSYLFGAKEVTNGKS